MSPVRLTHIGGPTTLIEFDGWRILTDPTFDDPGRKYNFGWGGSSRKVTGPALAVADLGPLDAILVTHVHHADNLDDAGRNLLPSARTVVTTAAGARQLAGSARGLDPWATTTLEAPGKPSIKVTATPCRHGPPLSHPIVGDVIGFALDWADDPQGAFWISGDTVLYDGVREVADRIDVDIALLHVGAVKFPITGPIRYTMTMDDAVELCGLVKPRIAIPVHYEGWSHFSQGRAAVDEGIRNAPLDVKPRFRVLPIGAAVELTD